jgi:hypothetical protein
VPNFSLMAKPLYEASKGSIQKPLDPSQPVSSHFKTLLHVLLQAPALRLPDLTRPFFLYISERQGFALGVLGHNKGPSFAPVAYLSKQLDPTTRGLSPCLRALAATSLLIQESKNLPLGPPLLFSPPIASQNSSCIRDFTPCPPPVSYPSRWFCLRIPL